MNYIIKRVLNEADLIIKKDYTVREIAKILNSSKSTVHKDLHERLYNIDITKFKKVDEILKYHINVSHIRGGESTQLRYLNIK